MEVQPPGPIGLPAVQSWQTLSSQPLLDAAPWLSVSREQVQLPAGKTIDDFYRVVPPAFVVVAATTIEDEWILVRGYKHGPRRSTLSMPAGMIEPHEPPQAAAERELLEETGYATTNWQALGEFVVDANRECGQMYLFLARNAMQIQAPRQDDTEALMVELASRRELIEQMRRGEFVTLAGAAGAALAIVLADLT
jgi:ADP-ribose pyrophosphatase